MADQNGDYAKKINDKLKWIIFFLVCITLNTCDAADRIDDLVDRQETAPPAATASPAR